DRHGYLPQDRLKHIAECANVPLYRVQEVASFFPHFRLEPPPTLTVRICQSMTCHLRGAAQVLSVAHMDSRQLLPDNQQRTNPSICVEGVSCLGRCDQAPVVCFSHHPSGQESHSHDHYVGGLDRDGVSRTIRGLLAGQPLPASPETGLSDGT